MQFLKTLFWMIVAVSVAIFATRNWRDVTIDLWGPFQADIKLPLLLGMMVLVGWLPTWLVMRGRLWRARRRALMVDRPLPSPDRPSPDRPSADRDEAMVSGPAPTAPEPIP